MSKSQNQESAAEALAAAAGSLAQETAPAEVSEATESKTFVNQPDKPGTFGIETKFEVQTNDVVVDTNKVVSELVSQEIGNGFTVHTNVGIQADINWFDEAAAAAE
jgi:hypothetical protein